ncbi:hypothetical protein COOONC_04042, partial [Cooperia oncophora]
LCVCIGELLNTHAGALIAVELQCIARGKPRRYGIVCLPTKDDLDKIRNRHKNGPVRIEQEPRVSRAEAEENSMESEQASSVKADIWKDVVSLDQSSREKPISLKNLFPDNKVVDRTLKRKIANRKKKESAKRRRVNREERLRELNEEKEEKEKVPHRESANRLIIGRIVRGSMIRWLSRLGSPSPSPNSSAISESPRKESVSESWSVAYASDPSEWERKFGECWNVAEKILEKKASHPEHDITYNEICWPLEVILWTKLHSKVIISSGRIYELIVSESHTQNHCLLVHKPILNPLLRLFDWCERAEGLRPNKLGHPSATEKHFVVLLNQVSECAFGFQLIIGRIVRGDFSFYAACGRALSYVPLCTLEDVLSSGRIYELIVSESHTQNHCLLVHKPILNPLLRLFDWCERAEGLRPNKLGHPSATEKHFVVLLNQICTKLAEDRTLLHFFFSCAEGADQFVVFSLLIPYLYEQNDVGQLARDALLLILSVSANHEQIAEFVAYKSAFCPVVATGLSGCFSQLSRIIAGDGVERFLPEHTAESLANFHSSLLFCNAVVQAAHPAVVEQICSFFYSGFLISVVKPALLQDEQESVAAATVYLQLCIETVTEPSLLRTVIRMLLLERDDERRLLIEVIVGRIANGDKLGVVSLSLLDSLLQIGCEDLMLVLILRHLLSMQNLTRAQLSKVRDRAQAVASAEKLLECVPICMLSFPEICSEDTLALYMHEGAQLVERRVRSCTAWKWRYDGVTPSPVLFRGDSDEEPNSHTPFTRLSSCRSSMSSASFGLNRYFASKNSHLTSESTLGGGELINFLNSISYEANYAICEARTGFLAELGGSASHSLDGSVSPVEEDSEFILPPIKDRDRILAQRGPFSSTSSIMSSSMVDYFQLCDDLSESEESPSSSERKDQDLQVIGKKISCQKQDSISEPESAATGQGFDTDAEMARSFVLSGWADVEDLDTFISLLDRRSVPTKQKMSSAETMAFIDSKLQYMREMESEKTEAPQNETTVKEREPVVPVHGQPIEGGADSSLLLECLLTQLEEMSDHSLAFNLQLANVLCSLAAYPQPLLVASIFNTNANSKVPDLLKVIERNPARRCLRSRYPYSLDVPPLLGSSGRRSHGIRTTVTTRPAVESEAAARDDAATKNIVHAAIVMANLCQYLAGIALQQSIVVVSNPVR